MAVIWPVAMVTLDRRSMVALMFRAMCGETCRPCHAASAMWNAELIKRKLERATLNYSDELCDGRLLDRQWRSVCACQWSGKCRQFLTYRDILGLVARVSRHSQHEYLADTLGFG